MSVFVPIESGFDQLLNTRSGPVGRDLERRLIACVSLAKQYATGQQTPLANNPEMRGPNVRTGRGRASIAYVIEETPIGLIGRYGTNVFYMGILERGELPNGAKYPFLVPAMSAALV